MCEPVYVLAKGEQMSQFTWDSLSFESFHLCPQWFIQNHYFFSSFTQRFSVFWQITMYISVNYIKTITTDAVQYDLNKPFYHSK